MLDKIIEFCFYYFCLVFNFIATHKVLWIPILILSVVFYFRGIYCCAEHWKKGKKVETAY